MNGKHSEINDFNKELNHLSSFNTLPASLEGGRYECDFTVPKEMVHKGLRQRHIGMIALAGTIGYVHSAFTLTIRTGLFLGSGRAIAHGGYVSYDMI